MPSQQPAHPALRSYKSQSQLNVPNLGLPPAPQGRALRKFQSTQGLSSRSGFVNPNHASISRIPVGNERATPAEESIPPVPGPPPIPTRNRHTRTRSNSEVLPNAKYLNRRPGGRKSTGTLNKRSGVDTLLREGPAGGNRDAGLPKLREMVLTSGVDADGDGMSSTRVYLWLALLNIPPLATDDYLSLIHRGRSPEYTKIRNDTFRTLATDPLFKRRVTEASLIRLLNAVAWKLYDSKNRSSDSALSKRTDGTTVSSDKSSALRSDASGSNPPSFVFTNTTDTTIYVQGMNVLCAPFLYASRSEVEAFALFHYFVTKECPGYIRGTMDGVHKGLGLVDRCLEIVDPKLASYLSSKGMYAELYAFPSVLTFCACTPPLPEVLHLWDFLFAYGPHLNLISIVAQLIKMRDTILASQSPNKILRAFPALDAEQVISLTVSLAQKIPDDFYQELVNHAK